MAINCMNCYFRSSKYHKFTIIKIGEEEGKALDIEFMAIILLESNISTTTSI